MRTYVAVKRLLTEGCSELPKAIRAQLLMLEGCYEDGERVCCQSQEEVALWAVLQGFMSEYEASRYLTWRAFEAFVSRGLEEAGFSVKRNVRVWTEERMVEFDVIGYDGEKVVVVECKRWKRSSPSVLMKIAEEHRRKVGLASYWLSRLGREALPVVISLKGRPFVGPSVVAPIKYFRGLLAELDEVFLEAGIPLKTTS